jgi:hypothetical protein
MSAGVQRELQQQDWPRVIKELTVFAHLRMKYWGLLRNKNLKGLEAKDIALKAIEAVFNGEWHWDPNKADLVTYLKFHVVKGMVANLARSAEVISIDSSSNRKIEEADEYNHEDELNSSMVMEKIRESVKEDGVLLSIVDGLSSGLKRSEICELNNYSTEVYDNAVRRLRTKLLQLQRTNLI